MKGREFRERIGVTMNDKRTETKNILWRVRKARENKASAGTFGGRIVWLQI